MNIMGNRLSINICPLITANKLGITDVDMTPLTQGLLTYDSTNMIVLAPLTFNICPFRIKNHSHHERGIFYLIVMSFSLMNVEATYQRMTQTL